MKIKQLVVASALSLTSLAAVVPVSAAAASPAAAPAPAVRYNGCTGVPDSGPTFNFTSACNWHDWCYDVHPYGGGYSGRLACDNGFLTRMNNWCDSHHAWYNPARYTCRSVATKYYQGVRALGGFYF